MERMQYMDTIQKVRAVSKHVLLVLNPFLAPEVKMLSKSSNRLHWSIHRSSDNHEC